MEEMQKYIEAVILSPKSDLLLVNDRGMQTRAGKRDG